MNTALKVALCEDSASDAALMLAHINASGIAAQCDVFDSGEALLQAFAPGKYDLIFMDIYMGALQGVDAAAQVRAVDRTVALVFTTTSTDHALAGYRLKAVGYLEKPVSPQDVQETLLLVQAKRAAAASITLLVAGENRDIPTEDILFFELQNHAVMLHTQSEILRTSQTTRLSQIEPMLPDYFLRCHHSYIVNLHYVSGIDKELRLFIMRNGSRVYIRYSSLQKAADAYERCLFEGIRGSSR